MAWLCSMKSLVVAALKSPVRGLQVYVPWSDPWPSLMTRVDLLSFSSCPSALTMLTPPLAE